MNLTLARLHLAHAFTLERRAEENNGRSGPSAHLIATVCILAVLALAAVLQYRVRLLRLRRGENATYAGERWWMRRMENTNHVGDAFGDEVDGRPSVAIVKTRPVLWEVVVAEPTPARLLEDIMVCYVYPSKTILLIRCISH